MTIQAQLTEEEALRYSRHIRLPEVGVEGQQVLKRARVLIVGAGGLGSPVAMYLAAAGVGHLGIVDPDTVELSNLQRQIIHSTEGEGRPKVVSALERIHEINPRVNVECFETRLAAANALAIIREYDLVVDGSDNFATRYCVNDACVMLGKPDVFGSVFRFEGQASVFGASGGPCYRCLYPTPPEPGLVPSCAEAGVFGVLPGIIGSIQANEAIKLILGKGEPLTGRLLLFDAWTMRFRELAVPKNSACPLCGPHPSITALVEYGERCADPTAPVRAAAQSEPVRHDSLRGSITAVELKALIDRGEHMQLIDVREPYEFLIAHIPSSILVPISELVLRKDDIDPARPAVVICRSGTRSRAAIEQLRTSGYKGTLLNLEGGLLAWADDVDSTMKKY